MRRLIAIIIVVLVVLPQFFLFGQEVDETGLFLSVHGCAFWSTSGTHGEFYGKKAHGAFGVGVGSRRSHRLTTFAYLTYHPSTKGVLSHTVEVGYPSYRYEIIRRQREIRMWLVNIGAELRILSVGPLSIGATVGAVGGLSTEEVPDWFGYRESNTSGVVGLLVGPTANIRIDGTPMAIFLAAHYRYAPSLNSIEHDDNSGVPLLIGLRCDI
jgi:hypothetical protein